MHQPQVLSRALNTHNYKKDVAETGCVRDRNPSTILGKAQDSLFTSKTGIRRLLGGSSKEIADPPAAPEEPETLEISEPTRQFASAEDVAVRVAKVRRSSMTTYTVNLTGAAGSQVQREVRRLAGLTSAFTRPSATAATTDTAITAQGASFDTVEEMGAASPGSGAGDGGEVDASCSIGGFGGGDGSGLAQPAQRPSFLGGSVRGGGAAGRGPVRPAFGVAAANSTGSGDPCRASVNGDAAGVRQSIELADVTSIPSSSNMNIAGLEGRLGTGRPGRPPSLPHAFLGAGGAATAPAATSALLNGSSGSLSISAVTPRSSSQLLSGQLGLMRDRKVSRHNMLDGSSPPPTAPQLTGGLTCPPTPGGAAAAAAGASSSSPVFKLPTLPATPGRTQSGSQIGLMQSLFTSIAPAAAGGGGGSSGCSPLTVTDSRPGSSRLALGRGNTTNILTLTDRRSSVENIDLGAAVTVGSSGGVGGGGGGGMLTRAAVEGGGGGGGRWFQQDSDDMEAMLSGNEELLERLMMAGMSYGSGSGGPVVTAGVGGGAGSRVASGAGDSSGGGGGAPPGGEPGLLLPRLADLASASSSSCGPQDRATAQLQELWKVQASVEDQLNRERQALAAGRARRASVLEDVAGQHQPRWQVSYNVDAPGTHAKLGTVDATRRSELDRAHLTKLVKEQRAVAAQQSPGVPAAAVSPVVARARRLSTVMVA